jgi:hypothetical protein
MLGHANTRRWVCRGAAWLCVGVPPAAARPLHCVSLSLTRAHSLTLSTALRSSVSTAAKRFHHPPPSLWCWSSWWDVPVATPQLGQPARGAPALSHDPLMRRRRMLWWLPPREGVGWADALVHALVPAVSVSLSLTRSAGGGSVVAVLEYNGADDLYKHMMTAADTGRSQWQVRWGGQHLRRKEHNEAAVAWGWVWKAPQGSSKTGSRSVCRVGEPFLARPVEWRRSAPNVVRLGGVAGGQQGGGGGG